MRALADASLAVIPERSAAVVGRLTGMAYALTHEELRVKVAEFTAQSYAFGEQWLRSVTKEEDLPMPADQLVRVIHALTRRPCLPETGHARTDARRDLPCGLRRAGEEGKRLTH